METLSLPAVFDKFLPALPNVRKLSLLAGALCLEKFPALTALDGELDLSLSSTRHWPLTALNSKVPIPSSYYENLPRTLTQIHGGFSHSGYSRLVDPFQFDCEFVRDFPPALTDLTLSYTLKSKSTENFFNLMPKGLTSLDMRYTSVHPSNDFKSLPVTLTCLRTHNLSEKNIGHIRHLTRLRDLGLYGGCMTAAFAKQLPRSLTSLRLSGVGLRSKGKYLSKGSPLVTTYSRSHPDLTALHDTLPPLFKLVIAPTKSQWYWWDNAYEILRRLPTSLEVLRLDFLFQAMHIFPRPQHTSGSTEGSPKAQEESEKTTDLFTRLHNLRHLCMNVKPLYADLGWSARFLPPRLYAYRGPPLMEEEVPFLPKTLVMIWKRTVHWSPCYDAVEKHLGITPAHYWIRPVQEDFSSVFSLPDCSRALDRS